MPKSWISSLILFILLTFGAVEAAEKRSLDVLHYDLQLTLELENEGLFVPLNELQGRAIISMRNTSDTALTTIPLILHRLMKVESLSDGEGNALDYDQRLTALEGWETFHVNAISVNPGAPLAAGAEMKLEIAYKGQLIGYAESGMLYVRETLDPEFTIIRYETFSYPQVAAPSDAAVTAARRQDAFDYRFQATVPKGHVVAHGSKLVGKKNKADTTIFTYESTQPDTVMIFPIAPYATLEAGVADFYFFNDDRAGAQRLAAAAQGAFALFENWFGSRLDSDDTIAFIEIPEYFGSQASSPTIIQTAAAYKDDSKLYELYHEISHLWNPAEPGATPSRWNEGFGMFIQYLADDHFTGLPGLDPQLDKLLTSTKRRLENEPGWRELPMKDFGAADATSLSYVAGGLFFGLVHRALGDDEFFKFYKGFYQQYGKSGATATGFADYAKAYGNDKVTILFDDWMLTSRWTNHVDAARSFEELAAVYE